MTRKTLQLTVIWAFSLVSNKSDAHNQRLWARSPVALPEFFPFSVPMSVLSFDGYKKNGLFDELMVLTLASSGEAHTVGDDHGHLSFLFETRYEY